VRLDRAHRTIGHREICPTPKCRCDNMTGLVQSNPVPERTPSPMDINKYAEYRRREIERKADRALDALATLEADIARVRADLEGARRGEASYRRTLSHVAVGQAVERVAVAMADLGEPILTQ
jgi:sugar-specific transcriptional regulator TrmB